MSEAGRRSSPVGKPQLSPLRHWGGFLLSGTTSFLVDSAILMLLSRGLGVPLLPARLVAISVAMVTSWLINRTITFPMPGPPTVAEFGRFAAVAWSAAAVNYAAFAAIVLLAPSVHPVLAIAVASLVAMVFAYFGMRFGVFRQPQ